MTAQSLLSYLLLLLFLGINLWLSILRITSRIAGKFLTKAFRINLPPNEKKTMERMFTVIWLAVGIYGALKVRWNLLAMVFAFLAFRSGANVSRTLVYSIHDGKIIERHVRDSRTLGIMGRAVRISLLLEGLFVIAFALAYKVLSTTAGPARGSASIFIVELWILGLVFGVAFGLMVARNNEGILLENQMAVVWFFTGKKSKEKTERTIEETTKRVKGLRKHLKR
ncbi:hypothetical protein [Thermococcus sp.]